MAGQPERIFWETSSLEEHVGLMRTQVRKSLAEGEIRRVTAKVMQGHADDTSWSLLHGRRPVIVAWGKKLLVDVENIPSKNAGPACLVIPLWNFVCMNVAYEPDPPGYDLFQTAEITLKRGAGDCDDSCIVFGAMLLASGIARPYARVISVDGERWSHVYAIARFPQGDIALDPTVRGSVPGWEYQGAKRVQDIAL